MRVLNSRVRLKITSEDDGDIPITHGQDTDPDIVWLRELLTKHGPNKPDIGQFENEMRRELFALYNSMTVEDGLVYYYDHDGFNVSRRRLVLGKDGVVPTINLIHGTKLGGHLGLNRTVELVIDRAFRPGLRQDIARVVMECHVCQVAKKFGKQSRQALQPLKAEKPLELITSDIVGPLPTTPRGNKYIIVVCDHFSKWTQAYPLATTTSEDVARVILDHMYKFGLATNILTDQGRNFQANMLRQLYELLDIKKLRTSSYHPECNGITERFNRSLKSMLRCFVNENQTDWDELLSALCYAYNASTHSMTGKSPYEIIFGRKAKLPIDLMVSESVALNSEEALSERSNSVEPSEDDELIRAIESLESPEEYEQYVEQLKMRLKIIAKYVVHNNDVRMERGKLIHDRKLAPIRYEPGDLVLRVDKTGQKGLSKKLKMPWSGPYVVLERLSDLTYKIRRVSAHGRRKRPIIVHHNNIKRYHTSKSIEELETENANVSIELDDTIDDNIDARDARGLVAEPRDCINSDGSQSMPQPQRRRRGRPRKVMQPNEYTSVIESPNQDDSLSKESDNSHVYQPPRRVRFADQERIANSKSSNSTWSR